MDLHGLIWIVIGAVMAISGWIAGVRMRRRARRALGRELSNSELTSLKTWINVEEAEDRQRGGKVS